jgi:hypothetical protein
MESELITHNPHGEKTFADCSSVKMDRLQLLWMDAFMGGLIMVRAFAATMEWMLKNRLHPDHFGPLSEDSAVSSANARTHAKR